MSEFNGEKELYKGKESGDPHANPEYVRWLEEQMASLTEQLVAARTTITTLTTKVQTLQEREAARLRRDLDSLPHFERD